MQMVSMKTETEADDAVPTGYDERPCLYLTDDQVEALGIKGIPAPGTVFTLQARCVVERVTAEAEEADEAKTEGSTPDVSLSLRITDMGLEGSRPAAATMLYGA